ncbi:hypothetical protein AKJ52_01885 [candidate division MSBL1 archaeon SCGC-AAA382C18]|uniref:Uncharacterized protein n=1 Tax=candidate division MSBL1 archaeon SCGC-AAA382C18 TaxID=1698281 RepID=A0A133VJN7_9EURY|nr:hypothetical protein AKJ52_01885 [candidate division MSBL1 archaeon SCGC-AAA382C18]
MNQLDRKGMVLSGVVLLLILPAMLLSATFLTIVETGEEGTAVKQLSDKASYTAYDMKHTIRNLKSSGRRLDEKVFQEIAENYKQKTGFGEINIEYAPFDIWVDYWADGDDTPPNTLDKIRLVDNINEEHCIISNWSGETWYYTFEAYQDITGDHDYNEPALKITKIKENAWKIKILPTFSYSYAYADVYWGNTKILNNVNENDSGFWDGSTAGEGKWENESKILSTETLDIPSTSLVTIELEDPRGTIHYKETFALTTQ